jgi:K+-transporting ATPase KdpF subunit
LHRQKPETIKYWNMDGTALDVGYLLGGIIAVFILGYLVVSLIKPDKF